MTETDKPGQQDPTPLNMPKGRTRNRILIVFGVVIFSLVLGLIFLPMPVARYLVAGQLTELGIVHKGFDSLEIDL